MKIENTERFCRKEAAVKQSTWKALCCALICALLLGACGKEPEETEQHPEGIWKIHFSYEKGYGDQVELDVWVENISDEGADASVMKRVGPMNYTGHTLEGEIRLSGEDTKQLMEIVSRYDLDAWAALPTGSVSSGLNRTFTVFRGDEMVYVAWNARFPKTLPPEEDIFYAEVFNFFNGIIAGESGWEEVLSEDLDDPRDNPAYGERTVTQFGKKVHLVPGTGTYHEDGTGALIDYGDLHWWQEEGFTGTWVMAEEQPEYPGTKDAELTVLADGSVTLKADGNVWQGTLGNNRYYKDSITVLLDDEDGGRAFTIWPVEWDSYERLHLYSYPGPVPEVQFYPVDVDLIRQDQDE